ncbi:MAG: hypothetical protein BIFFINMI_01865 [Phycisphaerae bacterium]|nr:hypothetical protein [Phycisphaerae bacterium]
MSLYANPRERTLRMRHRPIRSFVLRTVALLLLSVLPGCGQDRGFAIRPYLQDPGTTHMRIMWASASAGGEVRYGADGTALDARPAAYQHYRCDYKSSDRNIPEASKALQTRYISSADLTGLTPDTHYRYEVTCDGAKAGATFRTFPDKAPALFAFAVYGDTRTQPDIHHRVAAAMGARNPAFILHSGDMVANGAFDQFEPEFFAPARSVFNRIPVMPAPGNHEGGGKAYGRLFYYPPETGGRWYSFDYGDAHFVSLDGMAGRTNGPKMLEWLEKDLAASKAKWKIVYNHYPSYDVGKHRSRWGHQDFLPIFRKYGVDVVISGHSHGYQRFVPMFTPGENEKHPITYIVSAGGGAPLHDYDRNPYTAVVMREYHYMLLTVAGAKLDAEVVDIDGKAIDRFEIDKSGGALSPACLAAARDESKFDELHDAIRGHLVASRLPAMPTPGHPQTLHFQMGGGDKAMKFSISLHRYSKGVYKLSPSPATAQSPAGGTIDVALTVSATGQYKITEDRVGRLDPPLYLRIDYEIDGFKGFCNSWGIRVAVGAGAETAKPQPLPEDDDD